ncbi:sensor histidine kinase [Streptomyces sp. NPDC026589]|uniref:sensor histidine kinase n=1 Tax=Streptomyces sp. NPDC026589 TaxID=3155609 RepID=UPI0033C8C8DE
MIHTPVTVAVGHKDGRRADDFARHVIVGLSLVIGVLTLAMDELAMPAWAWSAILAVWFAATNLSVSPLPGRTGRLLFYGCAVLTSWVLLMTVSSSGSMVVTLLIVIAAMGTYLVPMGWVLCVVLLNCLATSAYAWSAGADLIKTIASAVFYLIVHLAVVSTAYAMSREALLRAEMEQKNLELEAAGVLLEESAAASERLRISRELHDSLGHQLTVLSLELAAAQHRLEKEAAQHGEGPAVLEHLRRAGSMAKDVLADVRSTVGELRVPSQADLQQDLERLARAVPSLEIHVEVDAEVDADEEKTAVLIRVAQEIITNTIKHAGAAELALTVKWEDGTLTLSGINDGATPRNITMGNGLTGLKERLKPLGGHLTVRTTPQFTVEARLPTTHDRRLQK